MENNQEKPKQESYTLFGLLLGAIVLSVIVVLIKLAGIF
jgi:hypothetical protein